MPRIPTSWGRGRWARDSKTEGGEGAEEAVSIAIVKIERRGVSRTIEVLRDHLLNRGERRNGPMF
jgi:hypothetical protein